MTLRAYSGINVAQHATVYLEPEHNAGESAANLISIMHPRTMDFNRKPWTYAADVDGKWSYQ